MNIHNGPVGHNGYIGYNGHIGHDGSHDQAAFDYYYYGGSG